MPYSHEKSRLLAANALIYLASPRGSTCGGSKIPENCGSQDPTVGKVYHLGVTVSRSICGPRWYGHATVVKENFDADDGSKERRRKKI